MNPPNPRMPSSERRQAARTASRVLLAMWEQATGGDLQELGRRRHQRLDDALVEALNIIEPPDDAAQRLAQ